ncbi:MAG: hypothetical protein RL260_2382 [Pseudomonadota bacterium]|jgi:hypothetical protein
MLKKLVYALALTGLASGQAFALTDAGFEAGSSWVPVGGLSRVAYGSPQANVNVLDDAYDMQPSGLGGLVATVNVDAVAAAMLPGSVGVGSHFGLIETCPANVPVASCNASGMAFSFNLGGPASTYGDYFMVRLMTADFELEFNDKVTVTYYGTAGVLGTDHVSVFSENAADPYWVETLGYHDSNWAAFGVPVGTNAIQVQVDNVAAANQPAGYNLYNRPIVAIDYAAAVSPVPEADVTAMMLAGLGVLGLVARRRAKRAA